MNPDAPASPEQMKESGFKAEKSFMEGRSEGWITVEFPDNDANKAQPPAFPLGNQLSDAIWKAMGQPNPGLYRKPLSPVLSRLAEWAENDESSGWRRKNSMAGSRGIVELKKQYSNPDSEPE